MAARRCSICSINYAPGIVNCPVCGTATWLVQEEQPDPTPDRLPTDPEQIDPGPPDNDDIDPFLHDKDLRWRAQQLRRAGMIPPQARSLALDRSVDIHWVIDTLLNRGCPPDTAFLIASA